MPNDFDESAKNYDAIFSYSEIGKAQRNKVHGILSEKVLENEKKVQGLDILEINCGTGEDANFFWKKGHQVIATDISEKMIEIARAKFAETAIQFQQVDIRKIDSYPFEKKFDMIFSNFGGLNCINRSDIENFISHSAELLNPSGKMVLVIMPKKCLWERFYFILKGQFKNAFRRNTNDKVLSNVDGVNVSTWYYQPNEMVDIAKKHYHLLTVKPIGICIPPSYLEFYFQNKKRLLKLFIHLERLFNHRFWSGYADHYLIAFHKK
jgi:SAM-dependent methyltransferase